MNKKTKRKNFLKAIVAFSEKIAKGYTKVSYFKAQQKNMKDWDFIQQEKRRLSTIIIEKLAHYKNVTPSAITLAFKEFFRQGGANLTFLH